MYKNWKVKKSEIEERQEEYTAVAEWCNSNNYYISDNGDYYDVKEVPAPTDEEVKQIRISTLKEYLASTDYKIIKIAEGSATIEQYADDIAERQAWRAEINALGG